jgi:hypothetical protein
MHFEFFVDLQFLFATFLLIIVLSQIDRIFSSMSALPNSVPNSVPPGTAGRPRTLTPTDTLQANEQASLRKQVSQITIESIAILAVNMVLIGTAIFTLASLVPQQLTRNQKLQEVNFEETQVANHVKELQLDSHLSQNPEVAGRIAEENGSFMRANKQRVVFLNSPKKVQ